MTTVAVTFYDVVKWVHISSVVVGLGITFSYGIWVAVATNSEPRSVPYVYAVMEKLGRMMVTPALVLILITGMYLTSDRWDYGYFFVVWGLIAVVILLVLGFAFFQTHEKRAEEIARRDVDAAGEGEVKFSEEYETLASRMARVGPLTGLLIILTVYVMTAKPFL